MTSGLCPKKTLLSQQLERNGRNGSERTQRILSLVEGTKQKLKTREYTQLRDNLLDRICTNNEKGEKRGKVDKKYISEEIGSL